MAAFPPFAIVFHADGSRNRIYPNPAEFADEAEQLAALEGCARSDLVERGATLAGVVSEEGGDAARARPIRTARALILSEKPDLLALYPFTLVVKRRLLGHRRVIEFQEPILNWVSEPRH